MEYTHSAETSHSLSNPRNVAAAAALMLLFWVAATAFAASLYAYKASTQSQFSAGTGPGFANVL